MKKFLFLIVAIAAVVAAFIAYNESADLQQESAKSHSVRHVVELELQSSQYPGTARSAVETNAEIYRRRMEQMGCENIVFEITEDNTLRIEYESEQPELVKPLLESKGRLVMYHVISVDKLRPHIVAIDKMLQDVYHISFDDLIDTKYSHGCIVGAVSYSNMQLIDEYLKREEIRSMLPEGLFLAWSYKPEEWAGGKYLLYALRWGEEGVILGSSDIANTTASANSDGAYVEVQLTEEGSRKFTEATAKAIGNQLAITVDGKVVSVPNVGDIIESGSFWIMNDFSMQGAEVLSSILDAAPLLVPMGIIGEK